ncbi:MAG: hypothetical protein CML23_01675 [Rhizobiaceae bacterium]|nr:hypothetical protein [Rhizobiaceae bacterium]
MTITAMYVRCRKQDSCLQTLMRIHLSRCPPAYSPSFGWRRIERRECLKSSGDCFMERFSRRLGRGEATTSKLDDIASNSGNDRSGQSRILFVAAARKLTAQLGCKNA